MNRSIQYVLTHSILVAVYCSGAAESVVKTAVSSRSDRGNEAVVINLLPKCVSTPTRTTDKYDEVFVRLDIGPVVVNVEGKQIEATKLTARLNSIFQTRSQRVLLVIPTDVTLSRLLALIRIVKESTVERIVLLTPKSKVEFESNVIRDDCIYRF